MPQAQMNIKKIGRNDPCHCGSGKKFKHCCQSQTESQVRASTAAVARDPSLFRAALAHLQAGRLAEAEALYQQILDRNPNHPEALHMSGLIAHQRGQLERAVTLIRQAVRISPSGPMHYNLGVSLQALGDMDAAIESYRSALSIQPNDVEAISNLGSVYQAQGKTDAAIESYRSALSIQPYYAEAHSNLGVALQERGQLDLAIASFRSALAIKPNDAGAHNNLGVALQAQGDLAAAVEHFRRAIAIRPDYADAHNNLSLALLVCGDLRDGWREYEWRVATASGHAYIPDPHNAARRLPRPSTWAPLALTGRRLLMLPEQGIGDELFFLRFAQMAQQQGAWLAYRPTKKIASLVQRAPGLDEVIVDNRLPANLDQVFLVGELPLVLGIDRLDQIPPALPLSVLPERQRAMQQRLAAFGSTPLLGVTWRAGTERSATRHKKPKLFKEVDCTMLGRALSAWPGEVLVLQRHPRRDEIERFTEAFGRSVHDFSEVNDDLEDMLALLTGLREYVGVSNTNMHLLAGLEKPGRVLIPHPPEWRWMATGQESPWFSGFELYRAEPGKGWRSALDQLSEDLQRTAK